MAIVEWEKDESVAIIRMNAGENRHNMDFGKALCAAMDEALADAEIKAIVLTGTDGKNFSQGIDLGWLGGKLNDQDYQAMKDFMYLMNEVFKKLLTVPVPTIAAISGHAFGNGAILSCACDFRFMRADRGYFCFPEVDLGIPFLPGMIAFCKKAFPYYRFNEMKLTGRRVGAAELEADHVITKACDSLESLLTESVAFAKTFQKKRGIFGEHKKRLHKEILEIMDVEDKPVIESLALFIAD